MKMVKLTSVLKRFSRDNQMNVLFKDMNFQVTEGELVVISGEPQTGKSTLLKMIAAMTPPNKGKVEVLGEDLLHIKERPQWRLNNIGFITHEGCLIPYMTVKQNLLLGSVETDPDYNFKEEKATSILYALGFSKETINETIEGLTSKEQILATIARIFMTNPRIILADEPTKALTGTEGSEVLENLLRFAREQGSTVIVVSNDNNIINIADRLFLLENCQLLEQREAIS